MDKIKLQIEASKLISRYSLFGWQFEFYDWKRKLGHCSWNHKIIGINEFYALNNPESFVFDTLLHEIAHALAPYQGHNLIWKTKAIELGCIPKACSKNVNNIILPGGKYQAICPSCNKLYHKHRKPTRLYFCRNCGRDIGQLCFGANQCSTK